MNWPENRSILKRTFLGFFFLGLCIVAGFVVFLDKKYKAPTGDHHDHTIVIPKGASLDQIAAVLGEHNIIDDLFYFSWNARLRGLHASIKAGEYAFPKERTLENVLSLLIAGKTVVRKFTAIEGQTTKDIIMVLNRTEGLEGEIVTLPAEGYLYPETYHFSYGDQRQMIVDRMIKTHQKHLQDLWAGRDQTLPLSSPRDALILASIVEKETHLEKERLRVAGLFYNRLRLGMRLQSDPTVVYGLYRTAGVSLNHSLSREDLDKPNLFNTYLHSGLPPGPICNPGFSSLYAVLHPEKTDALYFVTDGTGGHVFSSTYEEHKRHHRALRLRRQKAQQSSRANANKSSH